MRLLKVVPVSLVMPALRMLTGGSIVHAQASTLPVHGSCTCTCAHTLLEAVHWSRQALVAACQAKGATVFNEGHNKSCSAAPAKGLPTRQSAQSRTQLSNSRRYRNRAATILSPAHKPAGLSQEVDTVLSCTSRTQPRAVFCPVQSSAVSS